MLTEIQRIRGGDARDDRRVKVPSRSACQLIFTPLSPFAQNAARDSS